MCIQSLYSFGHVRDNSLRSRRHLPDIRFDTTTPFQKSTLLFLCPITSIFLGIGRLKNVWQVKPDQPDSCLRKAYYTLTGVIAMLGLGCVISVIRIVLFILAVIALALGFIVIKLFGDSNANDEDQPKCVQIPLIPLSLLLSLLPPDEEKTSEEVKANPVEVD